MGTKRVKSQIRSLTLGLFTLVLLLSFTGCSPSIYVPPGLTNQGILPLSPSDPFMGSNLFLAREVEKSPFLHNFFKGHGAPTAIEILDDRAGVRVLFFYARDKSVFIGVPEQNELNRQWIIRGPYILTRNDNRKISQIHKAMLDEPAFFIWGKEYRFATYRKKKPDKPIKLVVPPAPIIIKTQKPKTVRKAKKKSSKKAGSVESAMDPKDIKNYTPLNVDQQAILMSRGFAERSQIGDIIHTVKRENETLRQISKWYTGATKNTEKLQELNHLADGPLAIGTRITVPMTLLKRTKVMPDGYEAK